MKSICALLCLVAAAVVTPSSVRAADPAPGRNQLSPLAANPTWPAAWSGRWDLVYTDKDCDTGATTGTNSEQDTICTGESLSPPNSAYQSTCDGTIDDTSFTATCTGSFEVIPNCVGTFTYTASATRTGDSFTATSRVTITYAGLTCGPFPDYCLDQVITGTRVGQEPPDCGLTPALPETWGRLKARYED